MPCLYHALGCIDILYQSVNLSTNMSVDLYNRQPVYNVTFTVFTAPSALTFSR